MEGIQSQCPRIWTGLLQRCVCSSVYSIGNLTTYVTAQSFLLPQSPDMVELKPAVYVLKHILHDWSDSYCHTILQHLRDAAENSTNTKLLVLDSIVPYACCLPGNAGDGSSAHALPGFLQATAEPPLLGNWGNASSLAYFADMVVSIYLFFKKLWTLIYTQTHRCCLYSMVKSVL